MAATVSSIMTAIKSIASGYLGADWRELRSVMNLSANDLRSASKGYGVRPLPATSTESVTNSYALDHGFELVLMNSNPKVDDESQAMTVVGDLYDKQDEILKLIMRTKANLPGTVLIVTNPALSEPEFVNGREFVALKQQFTIRYRQTI